VKNNWIESSSSPVNIWIEKRGKEMKYFISIIILVLVLSSCREGITEESVDTQKAYIPGSLYINSNPDKARIYVNGNDSGKLTLDSLVNLFPGSYKIRLYYDSQRDSTIKIDVISGRSKYIYVNFKIKNN
jgi:hypothetical protein